MLEVLPRRTALYRSNLRGAARARGRQPHPAAGGARAAAAARSLRGRPLPCGRRLGRYRRNARAQQERSSASTPSCAHELDVYAAAGYDCMTCLGRRPARASTGCVAALRRARRGAGRTVGRRQVIARAPLLPEAEVEIGELVREEEGRHTTTVSRLYELPRRRRAHRLPGRARLRARRAITRSRGTWASSRWRASPPGAASPTAGTCASRPAPCGRRVEQRSMDPRRYESYRRLRRLREELTAARGPKHGVEGRSETDWRPASACASVPPSTYSSSPPIGTPCAMRLARMPRRWRARSGSARSPRPRRWSWWRESTRAPCPPRGWPRARGCRAAPGPRHRAATDAP